MALLSRTADRTYRILDPLGKAAWVKCSPPRTPISTVVRSSFSARSGCPPFALTADPRSQGRFGVDHPNIVTVYEVIRSEPDWRCDGAGAGVAAGECKSARVEQVAAWANNSREDCSGARAGIVHGTSNPRTSCSPDGV